MKKTLIPARLRDRFSYMPFDNSPEYYDAAAASQVNEGFHDFAMNVAFAGMRVRDGRLRMIIPQSIKDLRGRASIIGGLHRSRSDIPYFVKMSEAAGFRFTRPYAQEKYVNNWYTRIPFSEWGAVGVDRKFPNKVGLSKFGAAALASGHSVMLFTGGTRIRSLDKEGNRVDTRLAEEPKRLASILSVTNQAPLIPFAIAGVAEDDTRWISGLGKPVVAVMGDPIIPGLWTPDQDRAARTLTTMSKDLNSDLWAAQKRAIDLGYLIREA
jgi:hypothetical protein